MILSPHGCSDTCKYILARHIHVAYEKWHIIPCAIIIYVLLIVNIIIIRIRRHGSAVYVGMAMVVCML